MRRPSAARSICWRMQKGRVILGGQEPIYRFLTEGIYRMQENAEVYCSDEFRKMTPRKPHFVGTLRMQDGALRLEMTENGEPAPEVVDILRALRDRKKYFRLKDGSFLDLSEMDEWREMAEAAVGSETGEPEDEEKNARGVMEIATYRAAYMTSLLESGGIPVKVEDSVKNMVSSLQDDGEPCPVPLDQLLRPYQMRGFMWMQALDRLRMGGILADDMGLGKTLQVITTLLAMKERGEFAKEKAIAIVPATLMTNWMREIERFAPGLTASVYHGSARQLAPVEERPDVTITTYGTFKRDAAVLGAETWRLMVLDEAQAVKNTGSGITQAVRDFPARQVIAMSGTPVENRLMEYWSLLSIVQPGILGTQDEFMKSFAKPIETDRNERALEAFRLVTAPFMLRRLKTDKSIISDLPDRVVCDRYVDLTPEQAALYKTTLDYWMKKLEGLGQEDGMKRSSMLLSLITALKQICNSPSLYEKRHPRLPDSGKADSLFELVEECRENGRKMLVFTQYAEMGERLQDWFEKATGVRPDFLHGGVSIAKRAEMVDRFQNDPADALLIISLKAGGTGLNLTAASVVVHYDLWWNPAVENQATDRAFRIGQCRDVLVYRFLCAGTFEERINDMLERKRELADLTVATGEGWVGDLSTDELKALFRLESPENA